MSAVSQRAWRVPGQRTRRRAWGFSVVVGGRRGKQYRSEWTKADAEAALAKVQLQIEPATKPASGITLAQAVERYLQAKARKHTVAEDKRQLERLKDAFGAETPLAEITARRISEYKAKRLSGICPSTGRPLTAAAVNRPLALLRHLLRLAHEEWEVLGAVPRIKLEREPQGRIRWLEPDEEARLLAACAKSANKQLHAIVTVAMETGLRQGELLDLTWDRVDMTRGVLRLELTKSGRRREGGPHAAGRLQRPGGAPSPPRGARLAGWQHPQGVRDCRPGREARRSAPLPRPPAPLRLVVHHAGRLAAGAAADHRSRYTGDDDAVQPPLPEAPPR